MKNIIKTHPKTFSFICILTVIIAACTIKLQVDNPEVKIIIQLPNDGGLVDVDQIKEKYLKDLDSGIFDANME